MIFSNISLAYVGSSTYYLPIAANLTDSVWYQLRVEVGSIPAQTYGLVQMGVVSSSAASCIKFDWNYGFEYYHIEQSQTPRTDVLSLNISSQLSTAAGARQAVTI